MEKRLMTFIACLFLSLGMALAQTQVSGKVTSAEMVSQSLVHLSKWKVPILVRLPTLMVTSLWFFLTERTL